MYKEEIQMNVLRETFSTTETSFAILMSVETLYF